MRMIRTVVWVIVTAVLVSFIAMNWDRAPVNIWPSGEGYLHLEWPVGVIALFFFLLGFLPMWLLSRAGRWRLTRRINALEKSVQAATAPPIATSTQLEAESPASASEGQQN